jgi:hypothetical protein
VIRTGTLEHARSSRRHLTLANGTGYWKSDFILGQEGPQAFLVEQDPNTVILPHFHQRDQFQVVVAGEGMLGRHAVRPISVHYAGRHTGYGPINAGAGGLSYFSLRAATDPGALFLPESRSRMEGVRKRHLLADPSKVADAAALAARREAAIEPLLAPQPDGIAAWFLRAPPGFSVTSPEPTPKGDRFYVVATGEMAVGEQRLPALSVTFVPAAASSFEALAGTGGLEVLVLQFRWDGGAQAAA